MRRRSGGRIPEGEKEEGCLVGTCKNFLFTKYIIKTLPSKQLRFNRTTIHP